MDSQAHVLVEEAATKLREANVTFIILVGDEGGVAAKFAGDPVVLTGLLTSYAARIGKEIWK